MEVETRREIRVSSAVWEKNSLRRVTTRIQKLYPCQRSPFHCRLKDVAVDEIETLHIGTMEWVCTDSNQRHSRGTAPPLI